MSASIDSTQTPSGEGLAEASPRRPLLIVRDYLALTKPAINRMCLLMTAGGMLLAPRAASGSFAVGLGQALLALLGTALAVASANTFNMCFERDTDGLMHRTKDRPLAAGRISEVGALIFGAALAVLSLLVLALATNLATTLIGTLAILVYVGLYTPLKYKAPLALVVGAVPGAVPPLMGWTAVTGSLDAPGLMLFAVLFVWQMPHFIAIAVVRRRDYALAGIRTVPAVRGLRVAKRQALAWSLLLLPTSLTLCVTGVAGPVYGVVAAIAGLAFLVIAAQGARDQGAENRSAQRLFLASLIYLPVLIAGLAVDVLL